MCKSPCCDRPHSGRPLLAAAAAVLITAAAAAGQAHRVLHHLIPVLGHILQIGAITLGALAGVALAAWSALRLARWQRTHRPATCRACHGSGEVLWATAPGEFEMRTCAHTTIGG